LFSTLRIDNMVTAASMRRQRQSQQQLLSPEITYGWRPQGVRYL